MTDIITLDKYRKQRVHDPDPEVIDVTVVRYHDGTLKGFTKGINLSCPYSRESAVQALRAIALTIEEM